MREREGYLFILIFDKIFFFFFYHDQAREENLEKFKGCRKKGQSVKQFWIVNVKVAVAKI